MKRFFALLIAVMMLSVSFLSLGCSIVTRGSDYCYRFLDYIAAGSFDKAYEMIADSIKAPETEKEREDRLAAEEKEKEENRKIWRQVFGLDKAETPTPTPEETPTPEASGTPSPAEDTPTPTPEAAMENGMTPDPETGEYPVIDATSTPDESTPVEDAGMVDESEIPADQRDTDMTPVPDSSATPDPRPLRALRIRRMLRIHRTPTPRPTPTLRQRPRPTRTPRRRRPRTPMLRQRRPLRITKRRTRRKRPSPRSNSLRNIRVSSMNSSSRESITKPRTCSTAKFTRASITR